jgi:hypothetical protein
MQGCFDIHAVVNDAVQHRLSHLVVVLGFGQDFIGVGAESRTTVTACFIFRVGDLQNSNGLVRQGPHLTMQDFLAFSQFATMRARGFLWGAKNRYNNFGCFHIHACVLSEKSVLASLNQRRRLNYFKGK